MHRFHTIALRRVVQYDDAEPIAARFHTELKGVASVGDSLKDLQAAEAVGAQPILVLTGKGKGTQEAGGMPRKTLVFDDLAEASKYLVDQDD